MLWLNVTVCKLKRLTILDKIGRLFDVTPNELQNHEVIGFLFIVVFNRMGISKIPTLGNSSNHYRAQIFKYVLIKTRDDSLIHVHVYN